jgi:hypothetical protein
MKLEDEGLKGEQDTRPVQEHLTNDPGVLGRANQAGVDHVFEEYNGDHRNRMMGRTGRLANEILSYFWLLLDASPSR